MLTSIYKLFRLQIKWFRRESSLIAATKLSIVSLSMLERRKSSEILRFWGYFLDHTDLLIMVIETFYHFRYLSF